MRLWWGYNPGLPEVFRAAWGARGVLDEDGRVDLPDDRQSTLGAAGEVAVLVALLDDVVWARWTGRVRALVRREMMRPDVAEEFVVFDESGVVVAVNTLASFGYLYVVAYRKDLT